MREILARLFPKSLSNGQSTHLDNESRDRSLSVSKAAVTRWSQRGMPVDDLSAALAWHGSNIRTRRRRKATPGAVAPVGPAFISGSDVMLPVGSWRDALD